MLIPKYFISYAARSRATLLNSFTVEIFKIVLFFLSILPYHLHIGVVLFIFQFYG